MDLSVGARRFRICVRNADFSARRSSASKIAGNEDLSPIGPPTTMAREVNRASTPDAYETIAPEMRALMPSRDSEAKTHGGNPVLLSYTRFNAALWKMLESG